MQAAAAWEADHLRTGRRPMLDGASRRRLLPQAAVRPVLVMVRSVLAEQAAEIRPLVPVGGVGASGSARGVRGAAIQGGADPLSR